MESIRREGECLIFEIHVTNSTYAIGPYIPAEGEQKGKKHIARILDMDPGPTRQLADFDFGLQPTSS